MTEVLAILIYSNIMNNGNFFTFNTPGYHHYYPPFGAGQQTRQVTNVNIGDSRSGQYYPGPSIREGRDTLDPPVIDVDEENPTPNPKQKAAVNDDHAQPPNPTTSVAVKEIYPEKKKEAKVFIFRPNLQEITTPSDLGEELFLQFGDKIVPDTDDFPIGYFRGQTKLWIRTNSDLADAWDLLSNLVKAVDHCGYMV